ncbi:hypothetical protein RN001_007217 [Aquatica leii]|uniref:Glycosyl transferase CAP10 domain-containing protein n=1 Tax=Aquatica leii TaxID=1421715 RepID=A0AAN7PBD2_9COLE|nr:hypothetical protein RN001_007217 [Aquatica leii]
MEITLLDEFKRSWLTSIIGVLLFGAGTWLLTWNEGRAVHHAHSLDEAFNNVIALNPYDRIQPEYDGRLIHICGPLSVEEPLTEPDYGISIQSVKLKRRVQMYQWVEERVQRDYGDVTVSHTSESSDYYYVTEWRDKVVDSSSFYIRHGHQNPTEIPLKNQMQISQLARIGQFVLGPDLKDKFTNYIEVTGDERPERKDIKLHLGLYYHCNDVWNPEVGDIRVQFYYAGISGETVSVVGKQENGVLVPYITSKNHKIFLLREGVLTIAQMFNEEKSDAYYETWKYRATGIFILYGSFVCLTRLMRIIVRRFSSVPNLMAQEITSSTNLVLSVSVSLLIIATACKESSDCTHSKEQTYSRDVNEFSKYLRNYENAQKSYQPCDKSSCNCYMDVINNDLKPFENGITEDMVANIKSRGTKYQIINNRLYRDKDCMFPARCSGIEHFLLKLISKLPNLELIINTRDWPQIHKEYGSFGPIFSFSKTKHYNDIMYPAWSFWEGGPAIGLYPKGIGKWVEHRAEIATVANNTKWDEKIPKAFFRGSRTSAERDPLILLSREKPELVDAQYTKNQAWKSDADTLYAPPASEVSFVDHYSNANKNDINSLLNFVYNNDEIAKTIAENGFSMIWNNLKINDVICYWRKLLLKYTNGVKKHLQKGGNMMSLVRIYLASYLVISIYAFGGNEERFIKKYAMMKIYESCFGSEVIKQVRAEMKAASMKCASYHAPPRPSHRPPPVMKPIPMPIAPPKLDDGILNPDNSLFANAQVSDFDKLNGGILSYRPQKYPYMNFIPQTPYRPFQGGNVYPGFPNPAAVYLANPFQQFMPYNAQPGYGFTYADQPQSYYGGQRTAKHLDTFRQEIETITARMSVRARNVTCIMQELGYLDENMEPNYAQIKDRIKRLPVQSELRDDIEDGVTFCQQFSQCVPEVNKDKSPLSREFFRPMFFFKCYKYKKIEACIMKDVREKYEHLNDGDFDGVDLDLQRNAKSMKFEDEEADLLASTVYDFLYGGNGLPDIADFV